MSQLENNFSDQDEEKDLGEELLGKERAGAIKNFCKKVKNAVKCAVCCSGKRKGKQGSIDDLSDEK